MGFRGWTYEVSLDTPFPAYELAMDGFREFIEVTNPWGSAEDGEPPAPSQDALAAKIDQAFSCFD